MQCIRSVLSASARERDYWPSGQDRTQIQLHFINEVRIERLAQHAAAALDQYARDASLA